MPTSSSGASWSDVALAIISFGREDPLTFVPVMGFTALLVIVLLWWPVRLLGSDHMRTLTLEFLRRSRKSVAVAPPKEIKRLPNESRPRGED